MTEKEIKQLKQLLESSDANQPSTELDQRILAKAEQHQQKLNYKSESSFRGWLQPVASGVIAVSFTVALLFVFSQIILPEPAQVQVLDVSNNQDQAEPSQAEETQAVVISVEKPQQQISARDDLSKRYVLPSSELLLSVMQFSKQRNRRLAEQEVEIALSEIGDFLNKGAFDSARERYHELRQYCDDCGLPESLEALAQLEHQLNHQG